MMRIVAQLARSDLINTFPCRDSGLMLHLPASEITPKDIVEAFEGTVLLSQCSPAKGEDNRLFQSNCPIRLKWGRVQVAMLREMAMITFEDLSQEALGLLLGTSNLVLRFICA